MKVAIGCFIGLVLCVSIGAEPLLEGRVRLESGEPVADAQVRIFDLADLRRGAIARAQTDDTGYFALPLAALAGSVLPERFTLGQNYPNPFNPSTVIPYQLAASSAVRLEVFNLLGQHLATLVDGERPAGFHTATWQATDGAGRAVGAGVYIYRMTVGVERQTGRMVLLDGQAGLAAGGSASVLSGASGGSESDREGSQVYGLIVSGSGLVPYVDSSFGVESGMVPVELVVSEGPHSAGKATDDDCALCDFLGAFNDQQEEEEAETQEEEGETPEEEDVGTEGASGTGGGQRDLIIQLLEVSNNSLTAGQSFTLETTVHNQGANTRSSWLYFFRSTDATMDSTDVLIHKDAFAVADLEASATQTVSIDWTAPPYAGTYYYVVCLDPWWHFSNCSTGVGVTVEGNERGIPDLAVHSPFVSHERVAPGSRFTYQVEIENSGTGPAAPTARRFYRSDDVTIDATDTELAYDATWRRLEVGQKWIRGYIWDVPFEPGTYYYGICVVPTLGETNTENNCSTGVPIVVEGSGHPDLIVVAPSTLDYRPATGEFRLWATVRNAGSGSSTATMIRYYLSNDPTIDATDTQVRTQDIHPLSVEGLLGFPAIYYPDNLVDLVMAPTSPGTYYYGACVDPVPGESDTNNNCSEAMPMNVGVPDLAVGLAWASTSVPLAGQSFTLTATVRNQGPDAAGSTTLRYYRSDDATIDPTDMPIGTDDVRSLTGFDGLASGPGSRLAASGTSRESISVSAPSTPGTYYYGACADGVSSEANTDNNCSTGVYVRVVPAGQDPFNIELVFVSDFTDARKDVMQQAARRFETIITEGLPAVDFSANPHSLSFGDGTIVVDDTVDDLRIFVYKDEITVVSGIGGPTYARSGNPTGLPAIGRVWIGAAVLNRGEAREPLWQEEHQLRSLMLHETAHVMGFGTLWEALGLRHEFTGDTYFSGELAIQAFNAAGGENYSGNKVPVAYGYGTSGGCGTAGAHWREDVFRGPDRQFGAEVMEQSPEREHRLSAITIQSLADLGYVVDVSRADPYKLPASVNTALTRPSSAKPVANDFDLGVGALGPIYVGDEQGRISHTISSD